MIKDYNFSEMIMLSKENPNIIFENLEPHDINLSFKDGKMNVYEFNDFVTENGYTTIDLFNSKWVIANQLMTFNEVIKFGNKIKYIGWESYTDVRNAMLLAIHEFKNKDLIKVLDEKVWLAELE